MTHRWRERDSNHRSRSYDRVSTVAEGSTRTDKPDGVIFARRRRLAADPPLSTAVSFTGGTDGSNPSSSSAESANFRSLARPMRWPYPDRNVIELRGRDQRGSRDARFAPDSPWTEM